MNIQDLLKDINWSDLADNLLCLLKNETADLWKKEDGDYLKEMADTIAQEKVAALVADTEEKRLEHERNLYHLAAQVQGQIALRGLQLQDQAEGLFIRIIGIIIRTVAAALTVQQKPS